MRLVIESRGWNTISSIIAAVPLPRNRAIGLVLLLLDDEEWNPIFKMRL